MTKAVNKFLTVNGYPYEVAILGSGKPTWVFFHGFLGNQSEYQAINPKGTRVYITLKGFGEKAPGVSREDLLAETQVTDLKELFDQLNLTMINLVGYSMGARLALSFAMTYPTMVEQLVLESGTAGLETKSDREVRLMKDEGLAQHLEQSGIDDFVDMWEKLPLFATQRELPSAVQEQVRAQRLHQQANNVAASLRGFGTGSMPNYWPVLKGLPVETHIVTGGLDQKFTDIGIKLATKLPNNDRIVVPDVGHNVHLEAPGNFTAILDELV